MTSFGTSSSLILGITFVSVFTFFADDLNDWFHRRLVVEHPKTDGATRYAEAPQPLDRLPNGTNVKDPAWVSNVAAEGHASTGSGQNSAAKHISRSDLLTKPAGRPLDVSRVGKVEPQVDRGAADVAPQANAVQDQVASPDHKIAQSDRGTNASGEVRGSVAYVPGDKPAIGPMANVEQQAIDTPKDSVTLNDVAAAEEKTIGGEQRIEPAQKDVTAQPLDETPPDDRRRDVAKADAEAGGAASDVADEAAKPNVMAAAEEKTIGGEQRSEPTQKDVLAQSSFQPLGETPRQDRARDDAKAVAEPGGPASDVAEAAAKPNEMAAAEEKIIRGEQRSEPTQKDLAAQASSQPLARDDAKAVAEPGGPASDVAEAAAKPNEMAAAEEKTIEGEQRSEPTQEDVTAQASSQPLDETPPADRARDVAKAVAEAGGAAADGAAADGADTAAKPNEMAAEEEKIIGGEQRSEPTQEDVTAQASSQPLDETPPADRARDVAKAVAEAGGAAADGAAADGAAADGADTPAKPNEMAAAEEKTIEGEQRSEPTQKDLTAQVSSQPRDETPSADRARDVARAVAEAGGAAADEAAKPNDGAAEQTSRRPPSSEQPNDVAGLAASPSRGDAPAEVTARAQATGGNHWVITETVSPVDYSPVVTASISSQAGASGLRMAIHCRRGRTEVELVGGRSNTLAGRNKGDTVVTYSINDGASIARVWGARGSVASFKGDVVAFLRSLPDNGELAARIQDGNATLQEGRFVLDGLTQVRDKFALACRWREADDDAAAAAKSAKAAAAEQTSNLRGRHRDQIQKSLPVRSVRDPRSRQRGDAPVEIAGLAQTGTDAQLQPKACGPCQLEAFKVMAGDRWVISETTSPVDYSPIVTASILLQSGASRLKLSIICRRGRTDLELASDLPDIAAPKSARDVVVTHSINRDAAVEHRWDARGSVAYFKGDAVAFLRSLRDDGEIAVRISDGNSVLHEGRFVLDGLSYVRDKFASACKWPESGGPPSSQVESTMRKTSRRGKTQ